MLFVFWELVGLCSYLLIGFWFHRPAAARGGEEGIPRHAPRRPWFLLAILLIYVETGTFDIAEIQELAVAGCDRPARR